MSKPGGVPIEPAGWRRPVGYSNGRLAPADARLLFVSGQVGWDEQESLVSEEFAPQFGQALRNVRAVVEAAGGAVEDVVRMTFYVVDKEVYRRAREAVGGEWKAVFGGHYPACTLVEVRGLLEDGAQVEIEATAALPARSPDPR